MGVAAGKADSQSLGAGCRGARLSCLARGGWWSFPPQPQLAASCFNAFVLALSTSTATVSLSASISKF